MILSPLPQPDPRPAAIFRDELDPGGFEGGAEPRDRAGKGIGAVLEAGDRVDTDRGRCGQFPSAPI